MGRRARWRQPAALLPFLLLGGCGPRDAAADLRGGILFYEWPHGATLTDTPDRVAAIRSEKVRQLQELEDFSGSLQEWRRRTSPVESLAIDPQDFVLDDNIFFYFVASLRRPAVAPKLIVRVTRRGPGGEEAVDHEERQGSRMNRQVHAGVLLFSMDGLDAGRHVLRLELLDGDTVAAAADLTIHYDPGRPATEAGPAASPASR